MTVCSFEGIYKEEIIEMVVSFFVVYADGDEGKLENQTTNSLTKNNFSYKINTSENNL